MTILPSSESGQIKWFASAIGFCAALMLSPGATSAQELEGAVRWQDMGAHLDSIGWNTKGGIDACECPGDLAALSPDRGVAQWIENTFYEWDEYLVGGDDGSECVCIVMSRPESSVLTASEASTLLSSSMLWIRESLPDPDKMEVVDHDDPSLRGQAQLPYIGDDGIVSRIYEAPSTREYPSNDDRERVTNTTAYPWNTVAYMQSNFPAANGYPALSTRGTAFVVGPYSALTCGHNIYDLNGSRWASSTFIAPGQRQDFTAGAVSRPYGVSYPGQVWTLSNYINSSPTSSFQFRYDIGAVTFETTFSSGSTYMPVQFNYSPRSGDILNTSGYPATVRGLGSSAQWLSSGRIWSSDQWNFLHSIFISPGNSGGPTFAYYGGDTFRIVGVAVATGPSETLSTRFAPWNQSIVTEWISHNPNQPAPTDPIDVEIPFIFPNRLLDIDSDYFTTQLGSNVLEGVVGVNEIGPGIVAFGFTAMGDSRGAIFGFGAAGWGTDEDSLQVEEFPIQGRLNSRTFVSIRASDDFITESGMLRYRIVGRGNQTRVQMLGDGSYFSTSAHSGLPAIPVTTRVQIGRNARATIHSSHGDILFSAGAAYLKPANLSGTGNNPNAFAGSIPVVDLYTGLQSSAPAQLRIRPTGRLTNPVAFGLTNIRTPTGRIRGNLVIPSASGGSQWNQRNMILSEYIYQSPGYRFALEVR